MVEQQQRRATRATTAHSDRDSQALRDEDVTIRQSTAGSSKNKSIVAVDSSDDDTPTNRSPRIPQTHEALLRKIERLEHEKEKAELRQRIAELEVSARNPIGDPAYRTRELKSTKKFTDHKAQFKASSVTEYQYWVSSLETDHQYYPHYFVSDREKVFEGAQSLKPNTAAVTHWTSVKPDLEDLEKYTWVEFKEEMLNALGTQATRDHEMFEKWFNSEWRSHQTATEVLTHIESIEKVLPCDIPDPLKFHHFWRLVPADMADRMQGEARPKTRQKLVTSLMQLAIDNKKRGRSATEAARTSEPKRVRERGSRRGTPPKPDDKDKEEARSKENENDREHRNVRQEGGSRVCDGCGKKGHTWIYCYTNPNRINKGRDNPNRIAIKAAEAHAEEGKDQASSTAVPILGRQL
jgi:hypothetical protein